jgi:hypothetical protein
MNMDASEGPSLPRDEQLEVVRVRREVIGAPALVFQPDRRLHRRCDRSGNELKEACRGC